MKKYERHKIGGNNSGFFVFAWIFMHPFESAKDVILFFWYNTILFRVRPKFSFYLFNYLTVVI